MERYPVQSSTVSTVGYTVASSMLEIAFLNGTIYEYYDVPRHVFDALRTASSVGRYLNAYVVKAGYRYRRI